MARTRQRRPGTLPEPPKGEIQSLIVPDFLEAALRAGHPWIYRNHVPTGFAAESGIWVRVQAGRSIVWGLWDNDSQIAVRVFSNEGAPTARTIGETVRRANQHRCLHLPPDTTAFRLINGEGDGLPGVVIDVYGEYAVIATYSTSTYTILPWLVEALSSLNLRHVLHRVVAGEGDGKLPIRVLLGEQPADDWIVSERGVKFYADLMQGHKTGLYLDQRENRQTLAQFAAQGRMLNLFAYTGGFSLAAALAGSITTNVDISQPALDRARDNFRLNRLEPGAHTFIKLDCYEYLSTVARDSQRFDAIVCDPPSLARNRAQLDNALQAYVRLNSLGLRLVRDGGYYAAASCTAQVSPEAFRQMLAAAAARAGKRAQIVHEAGHAFDHPVAVGHPEGRYLKFIVLRVFG